MNEMKYRIFVLLHLFFSPKKFSHFSLFLTTDASVETCPKLDNDESVAQYHYFNLGCFGKSNIFVDHCDLHFCRPWDAAVCQNIHWGELFSRSCAKVKCIDLTSLIIGLKFIKGWFLFFRDHIWPGFSETYC